MNDTNETNETNEMNQIDNVTGTILTCSNQACGCELEIIQPCPHGTEYTCACGHPLESAVV